MGAKATQRTRARKGKRAGKKAAQKPRRLYPESVPPGMVAEVFDVSGAEAPRPSLPPPSAARRDGSPPRLFSKPPPAPPRPSARPAPSDEAEELELDEELLSEDLSDRLVTPLPTASSAAPRRASASVWLVLGVAVLGLGVVLGTRSRATGPSPARAAPPTHAQTLSLSKPATPATQLVEVAAQTLPASLASVEGSEPSAEPAPSAAAAPAPSASTTAVVAYNPVVPALRVDLDAPPFDAQAAGVAISAAFARAAACRGPADPPGYVTATLTYAPSGRITSTNVSGVFAGTPLGGCIAAALRGARVPPFSGDYTIVKRTTRLGFSAAP